MLSHTRLVSLLDYDPDTGYFTYLEGDEKGQRAGHPGPGKYRNVTVDGAKYGEHVLAWFYMTGLWPSELIDHRDTVRDNNVWSNLRESTHAENMQNMSLRCDSKTGFTGVTWCKTNNMFVATITINRKRHHLGRFAKAQMAHDAYKEAKAKLHTFNPVLAQEQTGNPLNAILEQDAGYRDLQQDPGTIAATKQFNELYITATEIMERLSLSRAALLYARKRDKLPGAISVNNGLIFVWERDKIQPHLDAWQKELLARRGH